MGTRYPFACSLCPYNIVSNVSWLRSPKLENESSSSVLQPELSGSPHQQEVGGVGSVLHSFDGLLEAPLVVCLDGQYALHNDPNHPVAVSAAVFPS